MCAKRPLIWIVSSKNRIQTMVLFSHWRSKKNTLRENHFTDLRFEWQRGIQVGKKRSLKSLGLCVDRAHENHTEWKSQKTNEMMTKKAGLFYLNFFFALNILAKYVRDDFSLEPDFIKRKKNCLFVGINETPTTWAIITSVV